MPRQVQKKILHRTNQQNKLKRVLCKEANVDCSRPLTICDIQHVEELLCVDILVVSSRLGNRFIRVPTKASGKQRLYLYLIEYENTYHFHIISKINSRDVKSCHIRHPEVRSGIRIQVHRNESFCILIFFINIHITKDFI